MAQPHEGAPLEEPGERPRSEDLVLRDEQRFLYALALSCLPFWLVDSLSVGRPAWDTLALRLGWAGLTGAMGWGLRWVERPARRRAVRTLAGVVVPNLFLGLVVYRLGGTGSPLFSWIFVMPLMTLTVQRGELWQGVLSTLLPLVSAGTLMGLEGMAPRAMVTRLLLLVGAGAVGMQMSFFYGRLRQARVRAEHEQRAVQEALEASQARALQAERLAQVGRLAAGVAHEVKNPLAYVQANLRFLLEEWRQPTTGADDTEYTEALQETMQGVERIHQIVKDLTALSRAEETVAGVGRCELVPVVDASVRLASVRLKSLVRLAVEVPPEAVAKAEPRRLGQVLLNLLLNAADAIEDAKVQDGRVAVRAEVVGQWVRVVVEDNGPGITAENLPRLFTTFFTTKDPGKGTGLGLALSRQYVEAFGGTLRAENRPEGGARFIVELPVA
ncbi:phospho-acceptor domain-containing protein [Archangium gephyra]|uniref:histidine kinase n=1 Tax=Archangium gephyra TaxID=48 RepID=A0AAC8Q2H0_9BACT|nr:HAMP domain-containing sensor histidine kinase [Archangium gephyra]AKI99799.1 Histidine kinase [Archangium gephyra]REG27677.1 phospho-acceptor domain-containing protein [Archangium gephyra]